MASVDLVIKNGKIATSTGIFEGGVAVKDGKIAAISKDPLLPKAEKKIDLKGRLLVPGAVDGHVHVYIPPYTVENFETGTRAAAVGGVTTIVEMPSIGEYLTTTVKNLKWKINEGKKNAITDFALYGGEIMEDKDTAEIPELVCNGVVGFKITFGGGDTAVKNDGIIMDSFMKIAETGSLATIHAENDQLWQYFRKKLMDSGRKDPAAHSESRPNIVEAEALSKGIMFSTEAGNRLHVAHLSTMEGTEMVRESKFLGDMVTAEVCPHHLIFSIEDYKKLGPYIVCNPPIRSKEDNEALWDALADGTIDMVVTDHCAFTKKEKEPGWKDIWSTPSGMAGLETSLSLILSEGVNKGRFPLTRFVQVMSEAPARLMGLYPRKGAIKVGSDADFAVLDLKRSHTIRADQLRCIGDFTPFEGRKVKGKPVLTIVRGEVVAEEGEVLGKPGYGEFIPSTVPE